MSDYKKMNAELEERLGWATYRRPFHVQGQGNPEFITQIYIDLSEVVTCQTLALTDE